MTPDIRAGLDRLLAAIAAAEAGPGPEDLAQAPVLDLWQSMISPHGTAVLWGEASGHPTLGEGPITTSPLVALDTSAGCARTVSRWYRLGKPFAAFEADVARDLGVKDIQPGFVSLETPGFAPINDPQLLARLLAAFIAEVRRLDAAAARLSTHRRGRH